MSDEGHAVSKVYEVGADAMAGEEFFEPHDDAYTAALFVLHAHHNDVIDLAK